MVKLGLHPHGRRRPCLQALGLWACMSWMVAAWGQEVIYRCGHEYTNTPRDIGQCERMAPQAITVIPGTRPAVPNAAPPAMTAAKEARSVGTAARTPTPAQTERDQHARTIVSHELDKARQQLTLLVQEYNDGEPAKWASESRHHQKYLDRVAMLKAAIERTQRDIDSLQRELDRRPVVASTRTP